MEAVKMPSTTQVKSQVRTASADMPKGGDEFMKLLQVKKDQARQPDPSNKTEGKKTNTKDSQKDVEDVSGDPKENGEEGKEPVVSDNTADQDALLQAAMQQTAAQMAGIFAAEQPQEVQPVKEELTVSAGAVSIQEEVGPEAALTEEEPVIEVPKEQGEAKSSGQDQTDHPEKTEWKALTRESVTDKEPELVSYKTEPQVKPQEKVQSQEKTDNQNLYGAAEGETRTEQSFGDFKTETIPVKTSQDTLPQDLARTISDRLPGAGRELIVELEPANLGKLTIKMAYEAGRAAVSIIASNPRTLEILNQRAAEIASILEEKTGQETIIYTEAPQRENQEENPNGNQGGQSQGQGQEERQEAKEDKRHDAESFAQQLRLGLV